MEYRVLGQVAAFRDGRQLALGSFRQRSLLAFLLMRANEVVSTDRLIDELWGESAGLERQNALWVHVSNLRSALEPERERRSEGTLLLTRSPGYLLQVRPEEVDAAQFEQLLQEGRLLIDHDPAAASVVLGEALALWRGRPYEDFAYESFAQAEIARLEELRLEAVELRVDADLRRGLAAELVGELEGLARQHPLRERLTALHMLALYRSERRADALKAYRRLRARLADELGIEPSAALSALEAQMLAQDPALVERHGPVGAEARLAVRGYELRERIGESRFGVAYRAYQPMVGREVAIKVIRPERANDPEFIHRFEAEAEHVARLEHPHIVPIYDYWREPDAAYLVQRLFRAGSLADATGADALGPRAAAQVAIDVGSALALAHRHGVVHGDIKPANILLDAERRAYVTDFSIARSDAPATPQADVYSLAVVLTDAMTGGDGGIPSGPIAAVLERATSAEPEARYADATSFVQAVQAALGSAPAALPELVPDNPYKGLRPFEEADAPNFFGRERLVERLLARLGEPGPRGRFVAIVGPSGGGKSSVVSAGMLPAVRGGALAGAAHWFVVTMTPGSQPFEELEAALLRIAVNPPASLLEQLTAGDSGIRRAVRRVLPDGSPPLLLVIDQFEELFTQAAPATAQAFLDALAAAVQDPHGSLRVALTLRADFYDRPLRHRAFGELLRHGTEVITPMGAAELERAIDGPAERVGVRFEPGLLADIVADVADRAGALPLLQYVLTELFDGRRGQVIELASYRQVGGVSAAVGRRAEALYGELDPAAQRLTRQLFLRLVALGDGAEVARRRVLRLELSDLGPHVDDVLDTFGRHRLLTFDRDPVTRGPTVEIAHEALLSAWARLHGWIEEGRDDVREQHRIAVAATEWARAGRDDGYLLRGAQLDHLAAWAAAAQLTLRPGERALLDASIARRDDERVADEERRDREQRLRRQTRHRARLLIGTAVVLAVVAALAVFAVDRSNDAERFAGQLAATTEARRLAAASADVAPEDPELAALLALQALDESAEAGVPATPEAEDALHWAIQAAGVTYPVADAPVDVRIGPDGPAGVFVLPLADLVDLARGAVTRTLTPAECDAHGIEPCPDDGDGLAAPPGAGPRDLPAAAPARPVAAPADRPLAGTTVTMWGGDDPAEGLVDELSAFQERTGIHVQYRMVDQLFSPSGIEAAELPDLLQLGSQPTRDLAGRGTLVDLSTFLDEATARRAHSDHVIDLVSDGSGFYGIPHKVDVKGLVWYPVPEFEAAGYTVPRTWDELILLSTQMVADGRNPWCLGLESDVASGWPATDWIEALVLRLGGVELYDQWVAHEIPFDHPVVREATSMFGEIAFGPGFVNGGVESINQVMFFDAALPMYDNPPGCWLNYLADFAISGMPPGVEAGIDAGFFVLPPITADQVAPTFGGVGFVAAAHDRPEVREFIRHVSSAEWGSAWAGRPGSTFAPAHAEFDPAQCRTSQWQTAVDARIGDLRVQLCTSARDSIAAGVWRHDGSDHMPPEIGFGQFWTGMVKYINGGPSSLDAILADIEAAWPSG